MVTIEEVTPESSAPPKHAWSLPKPSAGKLVITDESQDAAQNAISAPILSVNEAERYIEELKDFEIEDVGTSGWLKQHELIEKLNLQAHQSARGHTDEFVLEAFITFDKLGWLIRDLLLVDCWREHVFPLIVKDLGERKSTMRAYFVLYHEATVVNLLEVLLYHAHGCEAAGDALVELVDYCARKVAVLNSGRLQKALAQTMADGQMNAKEMAEKLANTTPTHELEQQAQELQFQVSVTAAAVLRFLCEHIESLPLCVFNRMLQTHDVMLLIIPLIENPPWTRRKPDGKWQKLVDFKWQEVEPMDLLKITKNEGQAWLALFYLICSAQVRQRYHFNSFRKGQLLRVRKYLNDVMLDQLPFLADVQRFIDELTVADVPEPTAAPATLLLEQVAVMREAIVRGRDWDSVAKEQLQNVFVTGDAQDEDLKRLANVYSSDWVDEVAGETKCGCCGKDAAKKCGRCGIEWYCSRECQVKQWKVHKAVCDLVSAHKRPDS